MFHTLFFLIRGLSKTGSNFDNRKNSSLVLSRALFANNEIYKPFLLSSRAQGVYGKMNNLEQLFLKKLPFRGAL